MARASATPLPLPIEVTRALHVKGKSVVFSLRALANATPLSLPIEVNSDSSRECSVRTLDWIVSREAAQVYKLYKLS